MATRKTAARPDSKAPGKTSRSTVPKAAVDTPVDPQANPDPCGTASEPTASLWKAGLKALNNVRHDVERHHAGVVDSLLGFSPARWSDDKADAPRAGFAGLDAFGLRKFEDVFDQRVGGALERLGMPTREELVALREQLDQVLVQMQRLEALAKDISAGASKPGEDESKPAARRTSRAATDKAGPVGKTD